MEENPNLPLETDPQPETVTPQPETELADAPETETPAEEVETIDYKAKFSESSREAQILREKLKAFEEKPRRELTNQPAETELRAAFPDWDIMESWQQEAARRSFNAERLARGLAEEREAEKETQRWNTDLEMAIAKNPTLQGKEAAFKNYANKPSHRGAPMETLIAAFLYESGKSSPAPKPKSPALEVGNGGPRGPVRPKQLSGEQLASLRKTDEKAWREYVQNNDIDLEV